jgi:hypothetical protein
MASLLESLNLEISINRQNKEKNSHIITTNYLSWKRARAQGTKYSVIETWDFDGKTALYDSKNKARDKDKIISYREKQISVLQEELSKLKIRIHELSVRKKRAPKPIIEMKSVTYCLQQTQA